MHVAVDGREDHLRSRVRFPALRLGSKRVFDDFKGCLGGVGRLDELGQIDLLRFIVAADGIKGRDQDFLDDLKRRLRRDQFGGAFMRLVFQSAGDRFRQAAGSFLALKDRRGRS